MLEGIHGVFQRVDGLNLGKAALTVALVLELGIGLLDEAGVGQHDGAEIDGGRGAMDFLVEAVLHKFRNEPDVIDVAVGKQHGIEACWIKRKIAPVQFALGSGPLEHAAIDENLCLIGLQEIAGAGDGPRGTAEFESDGHHCSWGMLRPRTTSSRQAWSGVSAKPKRLKSSGWIRPDFSRISKLMAVFQNFES